MRKFKIVCSLFVMMLVLSGCSMKTEFNMNIKNDKSMDFSVIMAYDNELIDGMLSMEGDGETSEYTDEQRWEAIENSNETEEDEKKPEDYGFKESKYEEGEYKGYKYTKTISNIDDISGETANFKLSEFQNISDSVVFVKDGSNYKAKLVMNSEDQEAETEGYDIGIDMLFTVTLPNKPISHNATKVSEDGKTLTWNLTDSGTQNVEFEFSFNNNTMLYIGLGIGAVAVVGVIAAVVISKKKKTTL